MAAADTLVIAHRGAWGELAENTLEAFEEAIRIGVDMVELDVRRTADQRLIAYHDAHVAGVPIGELRHDELRAKGASIRPPLLAEVVGRLAGRIALNVELKEPACVSEVVGILDRYGVEDCLLTSFLEDLVDEAKALAPRLRTGLVVDGTSPEDPVIRARRCNADHLVMEAELAGRAEGSEIPCLVWTVNDAEAIDRFLAEPAIVGLITDRPALALGRRASLSDRTARAERS